MNKDKQMQLNQTDELGNSCYAVQPDEAGIGVCSRLNIVSDKQCKKKQRGKKRQYSYIDFDQEVDDEETVHEAAELSWPGISNSKPSLARSTSTSSRQFVTYEDIAPKNDFPRHQSSSQNVGGIKKSSNNIPSNSLDNLDSIVPIRLPNDDFHCMKQKTLNMQLFDYIDPNVAATEKQAIFKPPSSVTENNGQKRKPLTASQRRKIEKGKKYREMQKKKDELAKQRQEGNKQRKTTCKFYLNGNCNKGVNCTFSHDCEIMKKKELCKFYVMGICTKGSACVYYHDDWPCKFFHQFGFCMNGDGCKFSHLPLTEETRPLFERSAKKTSSPARAHNQDACTNQSVNGQEFQHSSLSSDVKDVKTVRMNPPNMTFTHANGFGAVPPVASVPNGQSVTYKLTLIELSPSCSSRLPSYVNITDAKWSADPRVRKYANLSGNGFDRGKYFDTGRFDDNCYGQNQLFDSHQTLAISSHSGVNITDMASAVRSIPLEFPSSSNNGCLRSLPFIAQSPAGNDILPSLVKSEPLPFASLANGGDPIGARFDKGEVTSPSSMCTNMPPFMSESLSFVLSNDRGTTSDVPCIKREVLSPSLASSYGGNVETRTDDSESKTVVSPNLFLNSSTSNGDKNLFVKQEEAPLNATPSPSGALDDSARSEFASKCQTVASVNCDLSAKCEPSAVPVARHIMHHSIALLTRSSGVQKSLSHTKLK